METREVVPSAMDDLPLEKRPNFDQHERQRRVVADMERHIQLLVRSSEQTREKFFLYNRGVLPELENP